MILDEGCSNCADDCWFIMVGEDVEERRKQEALGDYFVCQLPRRCFDVHLCCGFGVVENTCATQFP